MLSNTKSTFVDLCSFFCNTVHMKRLIAKYSLRTYHIIALLVVSAIGVFGSGVAMGEYLQKNEIVNSSPIVSTQGTLNLAPFWKVLDVLDEKFVATTASSSIPTDQEKVWGAIEGLASSYGDPYTTFFPPKEAQQFEDDVRGDFGGIGIEIGIKEKMLTVVAPLKGTPGERAGLKAGDLILKIDNTFTAGMTVEDAVDIIRGPKGTTVTLTIRQNGTTKEVKIVRDTIVIPTVDTKLREDGVFVISLYNFSSNSPSLFRGALREFILSGSDKLVLDLRNNPGGYLEAAIDMASWFLPVGKVVVIEDSEGKMPRKIHKSVGYNVFNENLKMVVLINGGSASAAEILAGALGEQGVATIVGEKSYGKGSVQELVEITPETTLKVTVAHWLTPLGNSISQNGIKPDIEVVTKKEDVEKKNDTQLEKAVDVVKKLP